MKKLDLKLLKMHKMWGGILKKMNMDNGCKSVYNKPRQQIRSNLKREQYFTN